MSNLHGVICLWKFIPSPTQFRQDSKWELVESYGINHDGYALTTPKNVGGDENSYSDWTHKKNEDGEYCNAEMGRAVTVWTMSGVELLDFTPPDWASWLSVDFYK